MRILFIAHYFQPEPNFFMGLPFAKELIRRGHEVQVLVGFPSYPDDKVLKLDNSRKLIGYGFKGFKKMNPWSQDKGHKKQFTELVKVISKGGEPLISFDEIKNVTLASFATMESAQSNCKISL